MVYFDIKKDGKLQGRFIPSIHIPGIVSEEDIEKSLVGTNKIILESDINEIAKYASKVSGKSEGEIVDKILWGDDDKLPMDYLYMRRRHSGIEPLYTDMPEMEMNERTMKIIEKFSKLFKENNLKEIKYILDVMSKGYESIYKRDYGWHIKVIEELEAGTIPAMVFGAAHIIRDPLTKGDMNLIDLVKTLGYEVVEVVI
jgi:hypothetical protein